MNLLDLKRRVQGHYLRCADAPDMSGQNAAALASAALSKEQLDWAKKIYADEGPARAAAASRANAISDAQLDAMQKNTAIAQDYYDYQKNTFRPLEMGIIADAKNFDTEAYREKQAGLAAGDINQAFSSARDQGARQMSRMGVNPNDGKMAAMATQSNTAQALALADGQNKARSAAETQAYARKMDAANMGRNLASNQATSASIANQAGNSSASNALSSLTPANQGNAGMAAGYNAAMNGYGQTANIYAGMNQQRGNNNGLWGALGNVAGAGMMMLSDETKKKNIRPIADDDALAAIEDTPVAMWRYRDGVVPGDAGQMHAGPMAQDVQRTMGDDVAPGGKQIDIVAMNGITMAGLKALSHKVDALEKRLH